MSHPTETPGDRTGSQLLELAPDTISDAPVTDAPVTDAPVTDAPASALPDASAESRASAPDRANVPVDRPLPTEPISVPADPLMTGLTFLLALTVLQKVVGFGRNLLFCRWLEPAALGRWELAFGFFLLAAPLAVGGLPGAFGRYAEHFRQRGQLRSFLRRMSLASLGLSLVMIAAALTAAEWVAWFVFEDHRLLTLTVLSCGGLLLVIAYNHVTAVFESLRQSRSATVLRFVHALSFSALGGLLVTCWRADATAIVTAFLVACAITLLVAARLLTRLYGRLAEDTTELLPHALWGKMLPAAGWIWSIALLTNLFELADRWMIMHFSGLGSERAAGWVGQYSSSRALPMLLIGVVVTINNLLLPYLSCLWEARRESDARQILQLAIKCVALGMTVCALAMLAAAPLLFDWLLAGKYHAGREVLPWTLVYSIWFGLVLTVQGYLWCAERAGWACVGLLIGLVANVALNLCLLPVWGLTGAVAATAISNLITLLILLLINHRLGMPCCPSVLLVVALPLALPLGGLPATVVIAAVLIAATWTGWLFRPAEWAELRTFLRDGWARFRASDKRLAARRAAGESAVNCFTSESGKDLA